MTDSKTDALAKALKHTNVTELKSFIGVVVYHGKLLKDLSTTLESLHILLRKGSTSV